MVCRVIVTGLIPHEEAPSPKHHCGELPWGRVPTVGKVCQAHFVRSGLDLAPV